jgi:hypothetical protein
MRFVLWIILSALAVTPALAWDFEKHSIPTEDILSGGPPKDGIPALLDPRFVPAGKATFLKDDDRVLGFERDGDARAYPIRVLSWHELVNDEVKGEPILVSW